MASIGGLLSSALQWLLTDLEAGAEKGVRLKVERVKEEEERDVPAFLFSEKRKDDERFQATTRRERDEKTAFRTTSGLRPLAEPPILDWDWFFRVRIHQAYDIRRCFQTILRSSAKWKTST